MPYGDFFTAPYKVEKKNIPSNAQNARKRKIKLTVNTEMCLAFWLFNEIAIDVKIIYSKTDDYDYDDD